jgi:signal transduction histidine kinase
LENNLSSKHLPEAAEAAEIGKLVLQALTQTRSLARGLFPVELESHGLVPAIKELAETLENTFGLNCRFIGDETITIPDQTISSHLFRLTQEAVNNSIKHGKARHITVDLQKSGDRVLLAIRDDGVGLPAEGLKTKGLGLRIMSYRAQKIGGTFDFQPGESGGAVVTVSFVNHTQHSKPKNGTEAACLLQK